MKRFSMLTICLVALASLMATTAWAQNGHYIKLSTSISSSTACYDVTLKEAGLGGSGLSNVSYAVSATASFTAACFTKSGNSVGGTPTPKTGSGSASSTTVLEIRNGSTNGVVSICPAAFTLPDPGCTGSQDLRITAASYSDVKLDDQLAAGVTAGVQSLGNLSATFSPAIDQD